MFGEIHFVGFFVVSHDTRYVKVSHFVAAVTCTFYLDAKLDHNK